MISDRPSPTGAQKQEMSTLAREICAVINKSEDEAVVSVVLANVVATWLMSYRCADPMEEVQARLILLDRLVHDVGTIVKMQMAFEGTSKAGHA